MPALQAASSHMKICGLSSADGGRRTADGGRYFHSRTGENLPKGRDRMAVQEVLVPSSVIFFEDDFDGTEIDPTKWNTDIAVSGKRWCAITCAGHWIAPGEWRDVHGTGVPRYLPTGRSRCVVDRPASAPVGAAPSPTSGVDRRADPPPFQPQATSSSMSGCNTPQLIHTMAVLPPFSGSRPIRWVIIRLILPVRRSWVLGGIENLTLERLL